MALSIRSNLTSLRSLNHLARTDSALSTVLERMSSGKRINGPGDGPADLARGTRLETETIAVRQAIRNANDGITIVQTADAASSEVTDLLQRMRELAQEGAQAFSSGSSDDLTALNDEYVELRSEISRIALSTEFNDISLSSGGTSSLNIQVGINSGASERIEIDLGDLRTGTLGLSTSTNLLLTTTTAFDTTIDVVDDALDTVTGYRSAFGASEIRLDSAVSFATSLGESLAVAESNVMDADTAFLTSESTRLTLMASGAVAALAQASSINELVVSQLLLT